MSRNLAIVGCGAIAQLFYLPALARRRDEFDQIWLVDPNEGTLNAAYSIMPGNRAPDLAAVDDAIEFVIVAAPNSAHYSLGEQALLRGAHVLLEKPFVIYPEEGRKLINIASENRRVIAINQTRRFSPNARELRQRINASEFGNLKFIEHNEGVKFGWPFFSGAAFARDSKRTGIIMDIGVHVVDFYHYLFEPAWQVVSAIHDGFKGPEGLAQLDLQAAGAPVSIRLSRYYKQSNAALISFEDADVIINVFDTRNYLVRERSGAVHRRVLPPSSDTIADQVLSNFTAAVEQRELPVCDALSSLPVIEVLDEIYRSAKTFSQSVGTV